MAKWEAAKSGYFRTRKETTIMNKLVLTDEELEQVTGGTAFFYNTYAPASYNQFGISTKLHVLFKDEFFYMGRPISCSQADEIMSIGNDVMCSINSGFDHKDRINSTEATFQRAFNQQLSLRLGKNWVWDGTPGVNFGWMLTDKIGLYY